MVGSIDRATQRDFRRQIRSRHPGFFKALIADAGFFADYRQKRSRFSPRIDAALQPFRQAWSSDAFAALALYRAKARLQSLRVPILPRLLHRMAMLFAQVIIGDSVVIAPGIYLPHGQVVIDGVTEIERGVVVAPFVTIGLLAGEFRGPTIESNASIGTGAKLIGPIRVGAGARIGANSVVVDDVPPGSTVVGAPARPTEGLPETVA